jgi:hypothetical protein
VACCFNAALVRSRSSSNVIEVFAATSRFRLVPPLIPVLLLLLIDDDDDDDGDASSGGWNSRSRSFFFSVFFVLAAARLFHHKSFVFGPIILPSNDVIKWVTSLMMH